MKCLNKMLMSVAGLSFMLNSCDHKLDYIKTNYKSKEFIGVVEDKFSLDGYLGYTIINDKDTINGLISKKANVDPFNIGDSLRVDYCEFPEQIMEVMTEGWAIKGKKGKMINLELGDYKKFSKLIEYEILSESINELEKYNLENKKI